MNSQRLPKTEFARKLRRESSKAEAILWQALRNRQLEGFKFVRQEPLGPYVVDFLCRSARLVVEVDGATHATGQERAQDQARTDWLTARGYRVIRFQNEEVCDALEWVSGEIVRVLTSR